jgi:hypothetical protein
LECTITTTTHTLALTSYTTYTTTTTIRPQQQRQPLLRLTDPPPVLQSTRTGILIPRGFSRAKIVPRYNTISTKLHQTTMRTSLVRTDKFYYILQVRLYLISGILTSFSRTEIELANVLVNPPSLVGTNTSDVISRCNFNRQLYNFSGPKLLILFLNYVKDVYKESVTKTKCLVVDNLDWGAGKMIAASK